ncbi:hypothetical protein ABID70_002010 [Clavibacter michiganensis]
MRPNAAAGFRAATTAKKAPAAVAMPARTY